MYEKQSFAGWGDVDQNAHMRNSAYLDKAADVRMQFFAEHGFPISEFIRLRIGPVALKDEVEYFREVGLLEEVKITFTLAGLSRNGRRYRIQNEFIRADGVVAARVTTSGGWIDLDARRLAHPPEALRKALEALVKTEDFHVE